MTINPIAPLRGLVAYRRSLDSGPLWFMGTTVTTRTKTKGEIIGVHGSQVAAVGAEEGFRRWRWCGGVVVRYLVHRRHALGLGLV